MRKKFIFAAALCLTTLSLTDNINAAVQITQEVQQDGRTIRGTVIDNTGEPVIGANVTIKGTTNGVITDIDGNCQRHIGCFLRRLQNSGNSYNK